MKKIISLIAISTCLLFQTPVWGQTMSDGARKNELKADSLYRAYEFSRAAQIYSQMAETAAPEDKNRLELKAISCQNGEAMLHYVSKPVVVARKTLDKKDFFLYYPDISSVGHFTLRTEDKNSVSDTLFIPDDKNVIYYSAKDRKGVWNIYVSKRQAEGVWGPPQILGNNVTSSGNDIFPFVSADGKRLYFSSNGHYGAGGYDLYVSQWDEEKQDWGVAQNMGFPYSSTGDDFFFYITPNGKYAAFSSTRMFNNPRSRLYSTSRVVCYVVEYDRDPLKYSASPQEVYNISMLRNTTNLTARQRDSISRAGVDKALEGVDRKTGISEMDPKTREITENYTKAVLTYRKLSKERDLLQKQQEERRLLYSELDQQIAQTYDTLELQIQKDSINSLARKISDGEARAISLASQIKEAETQIHKTEELFLATGVSVPENTLFKSSEELATEAEKEDEDDDMDEEDFNTMLDTRAKVFADSGFKMEKAKADIDVDFKVLKKSVVADIEDFPDGLRYQIKMLTSTKRRDAAAFKGYSPVFERFENGRYIYGAGAFESYSAAYKQLARIKKSGFTSAAITAFEDGKAIPLAIARKKEAAGKKPAAASSSKGKASAYNVSIVSESSSLGSEVMRTMTSAGKDVAKVATDSGFKFIAGPFSSQKEADALAEKLRAVSGKKVSVEAVY